MKLFTAVSLLAIAGGVVANNCKPGLVYCVSTLLYVGNYQPQIDQALSDAGVVGNGNALFYCAGGPNGVITYLYTCTNGCHDAGSVHNDYCE